MAVPTKEKPVALSKHVAEAALEPFLAKDFDPANYLNTTLPSLTTGNSATASQPTTNGSLADVSSQAQTSLSHLNAQASRLTTVLTQMTDDILRSGGRLAYEVDVLRGEAIGLSDVVNDSLNEEIALFVTDEAQDTKEMLTSEDKAMEVPAKAGPSEPTYITQLRMLTQVRQRLDSVIKIFGEAMHWSLPPSEVSITSSFISVSGPETGSDSQSREQKGKAFSQSLRTEIADVVLSADSVQAGSDAAQVRIEALKDLAQVWKGTVEEKARLRFIETLAKLAEDRLKDLERGENAGHAAGRTTSTRRPSTTAFVQEAESGVKFLDNLYSLRQAESLAH